MRPRHLITLIFVAGLLACGGGEPAEEGPEGGVLQATDQEAELREGFESARAVQRQALEVFRGLANPAALEVADLERAMTRLNEAFLRGRREILSLRRSADESHKEMRHQLREANRELKAAFNALLKHHPDPAPDLFAGADDA